MTGPAPGAVRVHTPRPRALWMPGLAAWLPPRGGPAVLTRPEDVCRKAAGHACRSFKAARAWGPHPHRRRRGRGTSPGPLGPVHPGGRLCSLHGVGSGLAPRRVSAPPWLLPGPLEVADEHVLRGRRAGALGDGIGNHHVTSTDTGPGSRKGRPASCLAWLPVAG